ncbi:MAG: hypothetical protein FWG44_07305 [Oscillospiraceae bacterium]|nr:hypothetical protein [Oscillospiraceae bacterium]
MNTLPISTVNESNRAYSVYEARMGAMNRTDYPSQVDSVKETNAVSLAQRSAQLFDKLPENGKTNVNPTEQQNQNTGEKPDFAAINLMKKSFPDPTEKRIQRYSLETYEKIEATPATEDTVKNAVREAADKAIERNLEQKMQAPDESQKYEERMHEKVTLKPASEIAENDSGSKLTPAQQRGVETYVKAQNYSDAVNISNAATQIAA